MQTFSIVCAREDGFKKKRGEKKEREGRRNVIKEREERRGGLSSSVNRFS